MWRNTHPILIINYWLNLTKMILGQYSYPSAAFPFVFPVKKLLSTSGAIQNFSGSTLRCKVLGQSTARNNPAWCLLVLTLRLDPSSSPGYLFRIYEISKYTCNRSSSTKTSRNISVFVDKVMCVIFSTVASTQWSNTDQRYHTDGPIQL